MFPLTIRDFWLKHGAMSPTIASQIAQGQEAVFRYGQRLRTWVDQSSPFHPRLWCFLVGPVFVTTILLAATVNIFWKNSFDHGLQRQQEADESILTNFNQSSTDPWHTHTHAHTSFVADLRCFCERCAHTRNILDSAVSFCQFNISRNLQYCTCYLSRKFRNYSYPPSEFGTYVFHICIHLFTVLFLDILGIGTNQNIDAEALLRQF